MVRLTDKYFNHSRGIFYREWNEELIDILNKYSKRPTNNNGEICFSFSIERCMYLIYFDASSGFYVRGEKFFKTTKTSFGDLVIPCIEFFGELIANGYMKIESEE